MSVEAELMTKTPETFSTAQLLIKDFDGTVALSFEESPGGIGVHEAHELTVDEIFGTATLEYYRRSGGLRNRAPLELVQDLAPDAHGKDLEALTDHFNNTKLDIIMSEIGTRFPDGAMWPRPTRGYLELRERLEEARINGLQIDDFILSSGHEPFIAKTYSAWGVSQPTHIIAGEAIAQLALGLPPAQLVKPSPILMDVAHTTWRQDYGLRATANPADDRERMIYIGDDAVKDGHMARDSGVDFMLLDPANSLETWQEAARRLGIGKVMLRGIEQDA